LCRPWSAKIESPIRSVSESRSSDAHTIAVSGYYGCGNAGDEAVLAGIAEALRRTAGDSVRLLALSQDPQATRELHGLDSVYRMDMGTVRAALACSDLLISGGGSLLQDTTSLRSLVYYLWVARMALRMRVPVMFYAQGIGPLRRRISRLLVRWTANRVSYITVRDEASAQLLRSIGVSAPPLEVTADPAFALAPKTRAEAGEAADRLDAPAPSGRPKIGLALRPWGAESERQAEQYAALLTALEDQTGSEIVLIPMQIPGDETFSQAVVRTAGRPFTILAGAHSPQALLGIVGQMDAIVAMRLHTLIFAARRGVPPFALAYDPKVENLMRGLGLEDSVAPWTGFSPQDVAARVLSLLGDRPARSEALRQRAEVLEGLALRNAEIALSLVLKRSPR
jgi:polysaccharide pyruvyl transferase CsaB